MKRVFLILSILALALLTALPALAKDKDFGSFSGGITLNKWNTSNTSKDAWEWLSNSTTNNVVLEKYMEKIDDGNTFYYFYVKVFSNNDEKSLSGGSVETPGSTVYPFVTDETGDIIYVSKFYTKLSKLTDDFAEGVYTISVTFSNGTTASGTIDMGSTADLDKPSTKVKTKDSKPDTFTMEWTDNDVEQYAFQVQSASGSKTQYLVNTKYDNPAGNFDAELNVSSLSYTTDYWYFFGGQILNTEDNSGADYPGYESCTTTWRTYKKGSSGGDDDSKKSGCAMNPAATLSLEWLLLLAAPALALVSRRFRR